MTPAKYTTSISLVFSAFHPRMFLRHARFSNSTYYYNLERIIGVVQKLLGHVDIYPLRGTTQIYTPVARERP